MRGNQKLIEEKGHVPQMSASFSAAAPIAAARVETRRDFVIGTLPRKNAKVEKTTSSSSLNAHSYQQPPRVAVSPEMVAMANVLVSRRASVALTQIASGCRHAPKLQTKGQPTCLNNQKVNIIAG